ncbi:very short patch repair endonuclease [Flavihumibacter petaseus]|uniref:Very short patch repair endonuclease n=1 Tax=Flavihumibacter petaseus NBRC 106054 TaxID=1220578 RepID=A0A0E9N390_9BACT|nr:DNA mismatch endonuclease Vsr [Flavihumibacter petaseus]GAO44136.1 Vsr endonuclease [Flavihumibacter petaseus NBRC 106054]
MADVHSSEKRSYNMSRIKGANTKPEVIVRKFLFGQGYRFRLHSKKLPGKPDIVLPKYKTVIMINGCFWHGHINCKYFVVPKTRSDWWLDKINNNISRDAYVEKSLNQLGWKVIKIWECQLKTEKLQETLKSIVHRLVQN